MKTTTEKFDRYEDLFNLMYKKHKVTLTIDEMNEVITEAKKVSIKSECLANVSKPRFADWMETNGYWQDEEFAWKGREGYLTVDKLLSLKKEHNNL